MLVSEQVDIRYPIHLKPLNMQLLRAGVVVGGFNLSEKN